MTAVATPELLRSALDDQNAPAKLYLDLMKKALGFALWDELGVPIETFNYQRPRLRRAVFGALARALDAADLRLLRKTHHTAEQKEKGEIRPILAHTMIGMRRLDNLQTCIESVLRDRVPGDLIETGVWRGGACILMRAALAAYGDPDRRVFVADSFAGLPAPDAERYPADRGDRHHENRFLEVSRAEVERNFELYGLLDDRVVFLEGWFHETLPKAPIESLAVLRLDGDMYQSTMDALGALYHKLSPGGYCIVDDYQIESCRRAIADFREEHAIDEPIESIDGCGVWWRKRPTP